MPAKKSDAKIVKKTTSVSKSDSPEIIEEKDEKITIEVSEKVKKKLENVPLKDEEKEDIEKEIADLVASRVSAATKGKVPDNAEEVTEEDEKPTEGMDSEVKPEIVNIEGAENEKLEEEKSDDLEDKEKEDLDSSKDQVDEEKEENTPAFGPINYEQNQNGLLWKFIYIVAFFVGVGGAILIYQTTNFDFARGGEVVEEIEEPTPTEAPPEIAISDFPITVHNGAGIAGVAAAAQELLEAEEFSVSGTGNADNYDYTETVISAGEDVPQEVIDALRQVLEVEYVVADGIEDYSVADEILVIIGSETAN